MTNNNDLRNNKKEYLVRKHNCKLVYDEYMAELEKLILSDRYLILDFEKSDNVIERTSALKKSRLFSKKVALFENKGHLIEVIWNTLSKVQGEFYLVVKHGWTCGIVKLATIEDFNINFDFRDEHYGLIELYTEDFKMGTLFDFYEDESMCYICIESYGL